LFFNDLLFAHHLSRRVTRIGQTGSAQQQNQNITHLALWRYVDDLSSIQQSKMIAD
jgi:hypothetical protein